MRVVLDSNVLASGTVAASGPVRAIMDAWQAGTITVCTSEPIIVEVGHTLAKPYFTRRLTSEMVQDFLLLLYAYTECVMVTTVVSGIATHPEDDLILATAIDAGADLVTGDTQLLKLKSYKGTKIISPAEFAAVLEEEGSNKV